MLSYVYILGFPSDFFSPELIEESGPGSRKRAPGMINKTGDRDKLYRAIKQRGGLADEIRNDEAAPCGHEITAGNNEAT